ncbi:MAG TPA: hypothetical protein VJC20_02675 [Candidatus Paceibacterota bacterium]
MELAFAVCVISTLIWFYAIGFGRKNFLASFAAIMGLLAVLFTVAFSTKSSFEKKANVSTITRGTYELINPTLMPPPPGSVELVLKTKLWFLPYRYRIVCSDIRGGCPEVWPKKFMVVDAEGQLVVVPLNAPDKTS